MRRPKGVILAGGKGTRLLPATRAMNKHLIPILNRPMILYPLETLRDVFGITDILIVSGGEHIGGFADFLGDGSEHGVSLTYRVQTAAGGIAQALGLAADFVGENPCVVILGDNIFENEPLMRAMRHLKRGNDDAVLFLKEVHDAQRFGVATFDKKGLISNITEKPSKPDSNFTITGVYLYPRGVFAKVKKLKPSARGELEITDVNQMYVKSRQVKHVVLDGFWSDAGTPQSLARATEWASERLAK